LHTFTHFPTPTHLETIIYFQKQSYTDTKTCTHKQRTSTLMHTEHGTESDASQLLKFPSAEIDLP